MSSLTEAVTALQTKITNLKTAIYNKTETTPANLSACVTSVESMNKVYYLGTGTSFNVKAKLPTLYSSLTESNFVLTSIPSLSASGSKGGMVSKSGGGIYSVSSSASAVYSLTKSYNSSTGVLTCYVTKAFVFSGSSGESTTYGGDVSSNETASVGVAVVIGSMQS